MPPPLLPSTNADASRWERAPAVVERNARCRRVPTNAPGRLREVAVAAEVEPHATELSHKVDRSPPVAAEVEQQLRLVEFRHEGSAGIADALFASPSASPGSA